MAIKFFEQAPQPADAIAPDKSSDRRLIEQVKLWQSDAESLTSQWREKQLKFFKARMRIKKTKNFPFVGCSNLRMPTIETKIRKLKSSLVNVVFGIRPVVQVVPTPSGNWDVARKIEKFLDHLIMSVMNLKKKGVILIDQTLERGFMLASPYWKRDIIARTENFSLKDISSEEALQMYNPNTPKEAIIEEAMKRLDVDRSEYVYEYNFKAVEKLVDEILKGKEDVECTIKDVIYDFPEVDLCEPERVYVPTTSGYDPQSAEWLIKELYLPLDTLKANADEKGWYGLEIGDIIAKKDIDLKNSQIDLSKDEREGVERIQSSGELVKIWECYGYADLGKGYKQKCVLTIAPQFNKLLRKVSLPFYSGKVPMVKFFYELTDDRWFSHRGIPELIEDVAKEIDIQHMQKIDYGTMMNSPMFVYRAGQVNKNAMQFVFGQGIAAQGMQALNDIIQPLNRNNSNVEMSYEREQMILEAKIEELIGQVDFTLQSMINKRQPRTLGEVNLQMQNSQMVFSLDADLVRGQFEELFNWIWDLWCQYGKDEYEFNYFGPGANPNQQFETIKISKEEIQGKYKINVRGNDQNTNPQLRVQKAQAVLAAMQSPAPIQMGIVTPQNVYNAMRHFFQEMDIADADGFITVPKPPEPQPAPPPPITAKPDDLTDGEFAQVLQKWGIQPDIKGRTLRATDEEKEMQIEHVTKLADVHSKLKGDDLAQQELAHKLMMEQMSAENEMAAQDAASQEQGME